MNKCVLAVIAAGLLAAAPVADAGKLDSNVKIRNYSDWAIYHLYVSSADDNDWGPDQLGNEIIEANGGSFLLRKIPCDAYDIRLVDEDGDECVVGGVPLCADSDTWDITNDDLLTCQVLTD